VRCLPADVWRHCPGLQGVDREGERGKAVGAGKGAQRKANAAHSQQAADTQSGFLCYSVSRDTPEDSNNFEGTLREIRASLKRESRRHAGTDHGGGVDCVPHARYPVVSLYTCQPLLKKCFPICSRCGCCCWDVF
jgi:hypothetical protein